MAVFGIYSFRYILVVFRAYFVSAVQTTYLHPKSWMKVSLFQPSTVSAEINRKWPWRRFLPHLINME